MPWLKTYEDDHITLWGQELKNFDPGYNRTYLVRIVHDGKGLLFELVLGYESTVRFHCFRCTSDVSSLMAILDSSVVDSRMSNLVYHGYCFYCRGRLALPKQDGGLNYTFTLTTSFQQLFTPLFDVAFDPLIAPWLVAEFASLIRPLRANLERERLQQVFAR